MINKLLLLAIAFVLSNVFYAQTNSNTSVEGVVIDSEQGDPLEFVNIVVLRADSTFINGATTDETGKFSIPDIPSEKVILKLSFLGYKNQYGDLPSQTNRYALTKDSYGLQEVVITASKPIFQLKQGTLVVDVATSVLNSLGTANDVLDKIPGVSVIDDQINVLGKGTPVVYINNRKVQNANEINQLTSNDIETIEVIRNPGAKYDAETKSVIVIKTKKKEEGLSVNVFQRLRFGEYLGNQTDLNLGYQHKNVFISAAYSNFHRKSKNTENSEYNIYADTVWTQLIDLHGPFQFTVHDITGNFQWEVSKSHSVGIQYNGSFTDSKSSITSQTDLLENQTQFEQLKNTSLNPGFDRLHLLNGFYKGAVSDKFNYQLDVDYVKKHSSSDQVVDEISDVEMNSRHLNINSISDFELIAGKLVNEYTISDNSQFDFGFEYNTVRGSGYYKNQESYLKNNIYTNDEDKLATFVQYQHKVGGYDISVGLRFEHSHSKATEDSIKTVTVDRYSNGLYPNFNISKSYGSVNLSLSGSRKVRRPSFSSLTANNYYINRFTNQKGNPYLKNEDFYEFDLGLSHKSLTVNAGYKYIKNPIFFGYEQISNSSAYSLVTSLNYDKYQELSLIATYFYRIGIWRPQVTAGYIQPFMRADYRGVDVERDKPALSIKVTNDFILPRDFVISLYFNAQSRRDEGVGGEGSYKQLNVRLSKSFLNKSLQLTATVNDLFNLREEHFYNYIGNYRTDIYRKRETRYATFSIQYFFNSTKKQYRGRNASDDINRL